MRYHRDGLADDLVFKAATPITGGREVWKGPGKLEHGSEPGGMNNFQGRYAIRHPWKGPIACAAPRRGVWGGPPGGGEGASPPKPARDLAFAPRGEVKLASLVRENVPEIGLITAAKLDLPAPDPRPAPAPSASAAPPASSTATGPASGGCGCTTAPSSSAPGALLLGLGALLLGKRRRQRSR